MNKKLLYGLIGVVATLLVIILILILFPLNKNKAAQPTTNQASSQNTTSATSTEIKFDRQAASSDPIGDKNGPFYHTIFSASSSDGLTFTQNEVAVAEHASVPDALVFNGKIIFYAVDGANRSNSGLMLGVSTNKGKSWQLGSLHVKNSRTQMNVGADPQAVLLPDGKIRLFYLTFGSGPPVAGQPPSGKNKVLSAISSDGVNFTEEEGARFEYEQITDPDVIKIGNTWYLYAAQGPRQIVTTSSDGLSFTYNKLLRERGSVSKTVSSGDNRFRQFYCADGNIDSATTTDGLSFITDSGHRLTASSGKMICDPSPVLVESTWLMIYKEANASMNPPMPPKP